MTETTATRSYRPGQWFGIFGSHATVLLPPSEKDRVGRLWALVDDGAGFDVVLDALIADGLRDLPGFVLVATEDVETKVVLRGAARAWFTVGDDTVEVAGSQAATWAERSAAGVDSTRLVVGDEEPGDAPLLQIAHGLVRVSEVVSPPVHEGAEEHLEETGEVDLAPPMPVPMPEPPFETGAARPPQEPPTPAAPSIPPPPPFGGAPGPPPAVPTPQIEHDGLTQGGAADEQPAEAPTGPPVVSGPVARLVFSNGESVEVDRAVLVGRAPEARRFTSGDQPQLVAVPSPAQEISSTHLEIRPGAGADHGSAVVTDLGSTNGTVLVQPGLPPEDLQPGIAIQLVPGSIVDLGDGVTIQVVNP